jgi:hypothetical protein
MVLGLLLDHTTGSIDAHGLASTVGSASRGVIATVTPPGEETGVINIHVSAKVGRTIRVQITGVAVAEDSVRIPLRRTHVTSRAQRRVAVRESVGNERVDLMLHLIVWLTTSTSRLSY